MTYTLQDLLLSLSLMVYLTTCVVVAVVRWGHKCAPYANHIDYYFPGWRTLVFGALSNLALLPVVFLPGDPDALLQLRLILLLASPVFCSVLIYSYFGRILKLTWWKKPALVMSASYAAMSLFALVITLIPGTQMQGMFRSVYFIIAGALATFYLVSLVFAMIMIIQPLGRFSEESFSNPDDFPEQYPALLIVFHGFSFIVVKLDIPAGRGFTHGTGLVFDAGEGRNRTAGLGLTVSFMDGKPRSLLPDSDDLGV